KHLIYWKRSIYAATAARTLAAKINLVQQEEAFLGALLMDIGMLVLDQVLGDQYGDIHARNRSHNDLCEAESAALGMTHAEVAGYLAQLWRLPPLLTMPVQYHHNPENIPDPELEPLAQIVSLAGRCADVFVDDEAAHSIADVRRLFLQHYNLGESEADALMAEIAGRAKEVAALLEINIGSAIEYEAILKKANETLVEITLHSQHRAQEQHEQNEALKGQSARDGLTGLASRAALDHFLARRLAQAIKDQEPLSLLLIDVDQWSRINEKQGPAMADLLLRPLAKLIASAARAQDLAARYNGAQLALVISGTARGVASAIAETIRRAASARPLHCAGAKVSATVSVGVAAFEPGGPFKQASHLTRAAEAALGNALRSGGNCVRVFSLSSGSTPRPAAA
ncbi:MAG TPA: diguanylate cyclase, partial [Tepidisphaeraceae bacterium]